MAVQLSHLGFVSEARMSSNCRWTHLDTKFFGSETYCLLNSSNGYVYERGKLINEKLCRTRYRNWRTTSATQLQPSKSLRYIRYTATWSEVRSCVLMHLQHLLWWYILSAFGCCINVCICAMLRTRDTFSCPILYREFITGDATRQFHSKVVITQDLRIYVNVRTTLNIPLTNTECEGFPITHSCLSLFIFFLTIFHFVFIPSKLQFHTDYA